MKNRSILAGYQPRSCFYPKTPKKGPVVYYLQYYLPGGRRVSRPVGKKKKEARLLASEKEFALKSGLFDEFDKKRIPEGILSRLENPKVLLEEALGRFMEATSYNRRPSTNRNIYPPLRKMIGSLKSSCIDEVTAEEVQRLAGRLKKEGLKDATIHSYLSLLKTFFNWLIEDAEVLDSRNPVSRVKKPPKSSKVRDFLVRPEEILKILSVKSLSRRVEVPIIPLARFLVMTGCRLGEALHAEWEDFDLTGGIWRIRPKPLCPTFSSIGWAPKWGKSRVIELLPQALEALRSMPAHPLSWGMVQGDEGPQWHEAHFVFTVKRKIMIGGTVENRPVRISSVRRAWQNLLSEAGIPPVQVKDLRTFFNWLLVSSCGLSHKEAGAYLGNSEEVNRFHYMPVSLEVVREKMRRAQGDPLLAGLAA